MKKIFLFLSGVAIFYSCTKEVSNVNSKAPASMTENKSTPVPVVDTIKNERQFILFWSGNKNLASDDDFFAAARRQALLVFDDGTTLSVDHSLNPYNRVYLTRISSIGIGLNVVWTGDGICTPSFKLLNWLVMDVRSGSHTLRLHNLDTDKTAIVYQSTPLPSPCGNSFVTEIDFKKFPKD
jgi:hypothetical protein